MSSQLVSCRLLLKPVEDKAFHAPQKQRFGSILHHLLAELGHLAPEACPLANLLQIAPQDNRLSLLSDALLALLRILQKDDALVLLRAGFLQLLKVSLHNMERSGLLLLAGLCLSQQASQFLILGLDGSLASVDPFELLLVDQVLIVHAFVVGDDALHLSGVLVPQLVDFPHQSLVVEPLLEQLDELLLVVALQRLQQLGLLFAVERTGGRVQETEHRVNFGQAPIVNGLDGLGSRLVAQLDRALVHHAGVLHPFCVGWLVLEHFLLLEARLILLALVLVLFDDLDEVVAVGEVLLDFGHIEGLLFLAGGGGSVPVEAGALCDLAAGQRLPLPDLSDLGLHVLLELRMAAHLLGDSLDAAVPARRLEVVQVAAGGRAVPVARHLQRLLVQPRLEGLGVGVRRGRRLLAVREGDVLETRVVLAHLDVLDGTELARHQRDVVGGLPPALGTETDGVVIEVYLQQERPRLLELLVAVQQLHDVLHELVDLLLPLLLGLLQRLADRLARLLLLVDGLALDLADEPGVLDERVELRDQLAEHFLGVQGVLRRGPAPAAELGVQSQLLDVVLEEDDLDLALLDVPERAEHLEAEDLDVGLLVKHQLEDGLGDGLVEQRVVAQVELAQLRELLQPQQLLAALQPVLRDVQLLQAGELLDALQRGEPVVVEVQRLHLARQVGVHLVDRRDAPARQRQQLVGDFGAGGEEGREADLLVPPHELLLIILQQSSSIAAIPFRFSCTRLRTASSLQGR